MIIGLTGTNAAGKSTIAKYLAKRGFASYSLSDELRDILKIKGLEPTRDNLVSIGNEMRTKFGNSYLAERVLRKASENSVVDSIRNLGEIDAFRKRGNFILIAVDAPLEARYQRAKERGRVAEGESLQQFMEKEARELKAASKNMQQLEACMLEADFSIINASNVQSLYWQVETIIKKAGGVIGEQTAELG